MYTLNYIDGIITKEKYGSAFVRFLKILNFIVHLVIIGILIMTVIAYFDIQDYNMKIEKTKADIEEKRTTNNIENIEREWEFDFYKLLAIKTQMDNHTNYAYVFRDLGTYVPSENNILNISFNKNVGTVFMTITQDRLSKLTSFYDYAPMINDSFKNSSYLLNNAVIQDLEERKMNNKLTLKALKVLFSVNLGSAVNNNAEGQENQG